MEYHREEENEEGTAADRIGAVALGESSDKTETQDTNVNQPLEVWPKQERKGSWMAGRIKTIGEYALHTMQLHATLLFCNTGLHNSNCHFRNEGAARFCSPLGDGLLCNYNIFLFQLK